MYYSKTFSKSNPFWTYIPENLDLADLSSCGPTVRDYPEDALYFVGLIYRERIFNKRSIDEFQEINKQHLQAQLNKKAEKQIVDELIAGGIVETDNQFIKHEKSRGYRLAEPYRYRRHQVYTLTDKFLIRRVTKWTQREEKIILCPLHKQLRKCLKEIGIDAAGALQASAERRDRDLAAAKTEQERRKAEEAYDYDVLSVDAFNRRDYRFKPDPYGRVHTNISNMRSQVRQHLLCEGERLVEIDIANSQPLFFALLLLQWLKTGRGYIQKYQDVNYYTKQNFKTNFSPPPYSRTFQERDTGKRLATYALTQGIDIPADVLLYTMLCEEGGLYEYLMAKTGIDDRDQMKDTFFALIFDRVRDKGNDCFRRCFPTAYQFATECKRDDYRHMSHLLQGQESRLIINGVAAALLDMGATVGTVHDSILVTEQYADLAQTLIREQFARFNLTCTLKTKGR